jgi:hypothetical protein
MWKVVRVTEDGERTVEEFSDDRWEDRADTMFPYPTIRLSTRVRMTAAALCILWVSGAYQSAAIYHDGLLIEDRTKAQNGG